MKSPIITKISFILFFLIIVNIILSIHSYYQKNNLDHKIATLEQSIQIIQENQGSNEVPPSEVQYIEDSSIIQTVKQVKHAVVSIVATKDIVQYQRNSRGSNDIFNHPFFREFFPNQIPENQDIPSEERTKNVKIGGGSGFIYDASGLVLTNKHVVSDETADYTVVLYDGTELPAKVLARDIFNDVAVLQIEQDTTKEMPLLQPLSLGKSSTLEVGQRVIAIGNALAEFENTVTTGIISAKGRSIIASDGYSRGEKIKNLIQTDAAINPGNSGGPLVNLGGEVIGMNTAVAQGAEGIGFAIPIDDVVSIAESVKQYGKIVRPFIGVRYMMLTDELSKKLDLDQKTGALLITDAKQGIPAIVKNSPADKVGLQVNDIIIAIDKKKLNVDYDLRTAISDRSIGDVLEMEVLRNKEIMNISLTLEEYIKEKISE